MTPTPYEAIIPNSFQRVFRKLPQEAKKRVTKAMLEILDDPYKRARLMGELEGGYRWRVGEYRIRYRVDDDAKTVILLDVGPRRSIYN